jgi:glycerol uptake facilitator-like aquaporin
VTPDLWRKVVAESIGTGFLVIAVVGSSFMAQRLSPGQPGLQLLESSTATGAALVALVAALHPVSAAFNPLVTVLERLQHALTTRAVLLLVAAQILGALMGVAVANLMFQAPAVTFSHHARTGGALWLGEVVATFGLLLVVFATISGGRTRALPFTVGAYIAAAYWFTSSTSFANPAVTIARTLTDSFAGIAPSSALGFVVAQAIGAALAAGAVRVLYPAVPATLLAPEDVQP